MSVNLSEEELDEFKVIREEMMFLNRRIGTGYVFDNYDLCNAIRDIAWGVKRLIEILTPEKEN